MSCLKKVVFGAKPKIFLPPNVGGGGRVGGGTRVLGRTLLLSACFARAWGVGKGVGGGVGARGPGPDRLGFGFGGNQDGLGRG